MNIVEQHFKFQFHNGSIKREHPERISMSGYNKFQFHNGSIKSKH